MPYIRPADSRRKAMGNSQRSSSQAQSSLKNRSHDERARLHFRRWSTLLRMDRVRAGTSPYQGVTMGCSGPGPEQTGVREPADGAPVDRSHRRRTDHVSCRCRARSRAFGVSTGLCLGVSSFGRPSGGGRTTVIEVVAEHSVCSGGRRRTERQSEAGAPPPVE